MPINPTYPGVYVQEVPSGVRTIAGVSTSIAVFIGRAKKGQLNKPIRCLNYTDFVRTFSNDSFYSDLPRYVKLFFNNGGTDCYVTRIANGATYSTVTLLNEAGTPVLDITAKSPGLEGEWIRAEVNYRGATSEQTFNLTLFRWEVDTAGNTSAADVEEFTGLTMDANSPRYAPMFITQNSKLANASENGGAPAVGQGYSQSGRPIHYDSGDMGTFRAAVDALLGLNGPGKAFKINVEDQGFVDVDLSTVDVSAMDPNQIIANDLPNALSGAIQTAYANMGIPGVVVTASVQAGPSPLTAFGASDASGLIRIESQSNGNILIRRADANDAAQALMLGAEYSGLEFGANADRRPAPNGIAFLASDLNQLNALGSLEQQTIANVRLDALDTSGNPTTVSFALSNLVTVSNTHPFWADGYASSNNGNSDGIREKFALIRTAINDYAAANKKTFFWKAEIWGHRLALLPTSGADNSIGSNFALIEGDGVTVVAALNNSFGLNVKTYSVGQAGLSAGQQQNASAPASDGNAPLATDFDNAFAIIDKEVDLFNLMILPPDADAAAPPQSDLCGAASVFCQTRRAFLLIDAPASWTTAQLASDGIDALRIGLVKDHSAVFYPRLVVKENGREVKVGASGALAGLMARIDTARGVWKAPAGTEADLRGVVGLEYALSDEENGILNPRAINTIRVFPNGIVNWGARTMDGDNDFASEYKYIPIRRLALNIEESLYRGLKWVVFEPNDEPLWAQIRLNAGSFMHGLFRQGAFQGATPKEAYFVKCDSETTTQTDRNLGIVNIQVGFAPLKPAEFVILTLQQMALTD